MEEKFLKSRQEREEERVGKSCHASELTVLRKQFDEQSSALRQAVEDNLGEGKVEEAQTLANHFRALVRDAVNNESLTAYDMARANATLSRLQQSIDGRKSGKSTAIKKFRFSRARPTSAVADLPPMISATSLAAATTHSPPEASNSFDTIYGPASNTTIFIDHSKAVFVKDCTDCTLLAVPIAGSVFISGCCDCAIYVACHQLRMKDCHRVDVYVWCASTPIIESCDGMRFGPYEQWTGLLRSTVASCSFSTHREWAAAVGDIHDAARTAETYRSVDDFQWLKKSASPHWRVLAPSERQGCDTVFPST